MASLSLYFYRRLGEGVGKPALREQIARIVGLTATIALTTLAARSSGFVLVALVRHFRIRIA